MGSPYFRQIKAGMRAAIAKDAALDTLRFGVNTGWL